MAEHICGIDSTLIIWDSHCPVCQVEEKKTYTWANQDLLKMSLLKKEYLSCHELLKDRLVKLVLNGRPIWSNNERERERKSEWESKMNNDMLPFTFTKR